ncbi:undecaprenyl-diphosphate phosphatase [Paracidobacterium acidisoli]|uniref:Undecaprenyl-diphosphatase n=1 Tax=Paracidobacterium acidisoli TaxID=2303751 RepID=A0A372IMS4_9BACT|nr:undecaprenyl-diphosphate phosphatase [Paracidobacterium acidisoli]MBT9331862.1 undecaprenyl-diphosphate phosphatase [Paracidobacterium acidisoli]
MPLLKIVILAIIQGLAELLPVSSSAHVVVAERLMGLDASSPQMTLLLVMLHSGTMLAVIVYFWKQWQKTYFSSGDAFKRIVLRLLWATVLTAVVGEAMIRVIEKTLLKGIPHAEIEDLFNHLEWIAPALLAAGILILIAGLLHKRDEGNSLREPSMTQSGIIGVVQGFCLPFRGFSRSGATISAGMLAGVAKERAEAFSFALAVILTPPVVAREVLRLVKMEHISGSANLASAMVPGLIGAFCAFLAGLLALKWLSRWLEGGRWYLFGIYCLAASAVVFALHHAGY